MDPDPPTVAARRHARHLAHDLNNALAVVLSGADMIEDIAQPPDVQAAARAIASAAQEGLDLTARLTALARRSELVASPCDIAAALSLSRARLDRAAGGRAMLRLDLAEIAAPASIDRDQFLICVVEMIAVLRGLERPTTSDAGLVLRARTVEAPGPSGLRVAVLVEIERDGRDLSAGLDDASSNDASADDAGGAPGRDGLALVAEFARQAGGTFGQTCSGARHTLALRLPLIAAAVPTPVALAPVVRRRQATSSPAARAVVVEDNDFLRDMLVQGLRDRGLEVAEARDAAEARTVLTLGTAILVTDVVLPGEMDGFALANLARATDPTIAVLFVSGFMSARLPEVLGSDELTSFVRKPIELSDLLTVLDGLMVARDEHALGHAEPIRHDPPLSWRVAPVDNGTRPGS